MLYMKGDDRVLEARLSEAMDKHGDAVYRLALCRLQNTQDAEDVYRETFLRLFQENADGWDEEHMKAWLLRVAMNLCRDIGRKRKPAVGYHWKRWQKSRAAVHRNTQNYGMQ